MGKCEKLPLFSKFCEFVHFFLEGGGAQNPLPQLTRPLGQALKGRVHFPDPLFLWYQCVPLTLLCLRNYRDFRIRPFFTLYSLFKSGGCREYLLLGWCTTLVASFGKHIYLFLFVCPILIHIEKMCINMVSLEKFLLILCGVYLLIH